jgi:aspartate 1-decarboxylase
MAFSVLTEEEAVTRKPKIIVLNEQNEIIERKGSA